MLPVEGDFIQGTKVLEDLKLNQYQLFSFVEKGILKPHSYDGDPLIRPDRRTKEQIDSLKSHEMHLLARKYDLPKISRSAFHAAYIDAVDPHEKMMDLTVDAQITAIRTQIKKYESNKGDPYDWRRCALPDYKAEADMLLNALEMAYYHKDDVAIAEMNPIIVKSKSDLPHFSDESLRESVLPAQRHKAEARVIAEKKWKENPNRTITDMAGDPDIDREYEGKRYAHKTLCEWIRKLCPDAKRGRRKTL